MWLQWMQFVWMTLSEEICAAGGVRRASESGDGAVLFGGLFKVFLPFNIYHGEIQSVSAESVR